MRERETAAERDERERDKRERERKVNRKDFRVSDFFLSAPSPPTHTHPFPLVKRF